jgi:hypothetical protein
MPCDNCDTWYASENSTKGSEDLRSHREAPAGKLARGPAKPDDIERLRQELDETASPEIRAERKLDEVEAACDTIRADVDELKRVIAAEARTR